MSISGLTKEIKPLRLAVIGGGLNSAAGYSHFVSTQLDGLFHSYIKAILQKIIYRLE